ncbi:hypothetical protein CS022_23640 [Veronia nyctiphanis]|uniref:Sulfatase N-terminal domain-containing protein n=1 Tax=Veronia nyctiphanis TaxID=1278244 RepID=A0A4Q0YIY6_9GAMM|nr:tectonin domain-containing protein [Veronia nyctiphanis]RXJ69814.1 hypothetical protein CS022_23640 [Veronia nyctiphanis]
MRNCNAKLKCLSTYLALVIKALITAVIMLPSSALSASKPNIVTIILDDVSDYQFGYQSDYYETPNIDELAENGIIFEKALAYPKCSPTRNALLTGRNPARIGATQVLNHTQKPNPDPEKHYVPLAEPILSFASESDASIGASMKEIGYKTAYVGKWHINFEKPTDGGSGYGFDKVLNLAGIKRDPDKNCLEGETDVHRNEEFTDDVISWLDSSDGNAPFFVNIAYHAIHGPHCVDDEANLQRFINKGIQNEFSRHNAMQAGMLFEVDEQIGRVIQKIKEMGQYDNTTFIIYGDNGAWIADAELRFVRGEKGSLYQGGIHVPLVISGKTVKDRGRRATNLVMPEDLFATTLSIATKSANPQLPAESDSESVWRVLQNEVGQLRSHGVIHQPHYSKRAQNGRWKGGVTPGTAVINRVVKNSNKQWKLIRNWEPELGGTGGTYELYDLISDPLEKYNVASRHPNVVSQLKTKLQEFENAGKFNKPSQNSAIYGDVVGVNDADSIYTKPQHGPYGSKAWPRISGKLKHVSSGKDFIWGVNSNDNIFMCAKPCKGDGWVKIPGKLMQLDVGEERIYGVNSNNNIYWRPVDGSGGWTQITGQLKHVSVGTDWVWGVNSNDNIYQCKLPCNGSWTQVSGKLSQLDVGKTEVWGVNKDGNIYKRPADGSGSNWQQIKGLLKHVTVGKDYIWGVNSVRKIFKCVHPCEGSWMLESGNLKQIDAE